MGSWRRVGTLLGAHCLIVLFAVSLCGCAAIDQFSPRAQDYNRETAESKSNQILLNVVRSAYSQPLQFTEVSSVSANASVNGTLAATVPFPLDIAARTGARTISATPSASLTGGNTVSVANLNTQEFYQGLQKPLSKAQITYYLFSGFYDLDPDALLPLFVSEIQGHRQPRKKDRSQEIGRRPCRHSQRFLRLPHNLFGAVYVPSRAARQSLRTLGH